MTTRIAWLLALMTAAPLAAADDWPQWRGPNRDGVWKETGILERFDAPQIPIRWRMPVGPGYTGPTVAGGRVYVKGKRFGSQKGSRRRYSSAQASQTTKPAMHRNAVRPRRSNRSPRSSGPSSGISGRSRILGR